MATALGMVYRIRRVVRLRQMLRNWRNKALSPSFSAFGGLQPDVPTGHVAIYAGREGSVRRFVIRATHLNHPVFMKLLSEAEEEYGFGRAGPLTIPCEEYAFEDAIRMVSCSQEVGCRKAEEFWSLLFGLVLKPVWQNRIVEESQSNSIPGSVP